MSRQVSLGDREYAAGHMAKKGDTVAQLTLAQRMERLLRTYFQACNDADARAIAACFTPEAAHYFPHHAGRTTKLIGAATIGSKFARVVQEQGVFWTVDQLLSDVDRYSAALEWTRFKAPLIIKGII